MTKLLLIFLFALIFFTQQSPVNCNSGSSGNILSLEDFEDFEVLGVDCHDKLICTVKCPNGNTAYFDVGNTPNLRIAYYRGCTSEKISRINSNYNALLNSLGKYKNEFSFAFYLYQSFTTQLKRLCENTPESPAVVYQRLWFSSKFFDTWRKESIFYRSGKWFNPGYREIAENFFSKVDEFTQNSINTLAENCPCSRLTSSQNQQYANLVQSTCNSL